MDVVANVFEAVFEAFIIELLMILGFSAIAILVVLSATCLIYKRCKK